MKLVHILVAGLGLCLMATSALAKVPKSQADRLGNDLTPIGAEKAGDGAIPAWTGGLENVPGNVAYTPGEKLEDPFAADPLKFTITAANMDQYSENLSEGYKTLLRTFPDTYFMNVYQSRRSCAYPDTVYTATKNNAEVGELIGGGTGIAEAIMGFPFPIPNNALEIIWNHTLRYRSFKSTRQFTVAPVTRSGDYTLRTVQDEFFLKWSDPSARRAEDLDNISFLWLGNIVSPARSAGNVFLVHETLNQAIESRRAWQYSAGTRRVRRAPDIAYDFATADTDLLATTDNFDGYSGSPDRYDWTVTGKSKKYIAYNNYVAESTPYAEFLNVRHLNQDKIRYELQRVWTIQATLKPDARHVYARRVKHLNEDNWQLANGELYDSRGGLWRVQELHTLQRYNVPLCGSGAEIVYDLQEGRYVAMSMQNEEPPVNYFADELDESRYTPSSIRRIGIR
ncbi:MAG: DUF1329 domain-containing protein [Parvularculales bacterium]